MSGSLVPDPDMPNAEPVWCGSAWDPACGRSGVPTRLRGSRVRGDAPVEVFAMHHPQSDVPVDMYHPGRGGRTTCPGSRREVPEPITELTAWEAL